MKHPAADCLPLLAKSFDRVTTRLGKVGANPTGGTEAMTMADEKKKQQPLDQVPQAIQHVKQMNEAIAAVLKACPRLAVANAVEDLSPPVVS